MVSEPLLQCPGGWGDLAAEDLGLEDPEAEGLAPKTSGLEDSGPEGLGSKD